MSASPAWWAKLGLSLGLIGYGAAASMGVPGIPLGRELLAPPYAAGAGLAVAGGSIELSHYVILKRKARALGRPSELVTGGGLLRWVRHPMYWGDLVMLTGFAGLAGDCLACGLWLLAVACVVQQTRLEDRLLGQAFGPRHAAWAARTKLLVPWVY